MAPSPPVLVAVFLALSIPVRVTAPDAVLTEQDAVRLFLERSPQSRKPPLVETAVREDSRGAALLSNPVVGYQVEDAGGVRDEFLTVEQALPITGRRGLLGQRGGLAAEAAALGARRELQAVVAAVRSAFYEALYRETELDRVREGVERLARVVEILRDREREGESSGYDLLRAEQELAEAGIAASEAEGALAAARARLGSYLGPEIDLQAIRLSGDFDPAGPVPERARAVEEALSSRDDLNALRADARRLEVEMRAERRKRIPEPTLAAGWKRTEAQDLRETGFVASLSVPLPVFDRGQTAAARAAAEAERTALDVEILEREIRAEVESALARERVARDAVARHGNGVDRRAEELRRIAGLAYEEGESGILDLLDAHRSSLAMELRALAVRHEAKRAEIDRGRVVGTEVMP